MRKKKEKRKKKKEKRKKKKEKRKKKKEKRKKKERKNILSNTPNNRLENEVTAWERFQLVLVGGGWGLLLLWMIMSRCGEEWKKIKEPEGTVYEEYLVERDYQERETYVHSS